LNCGKPALIAARLSVFGDLISQEDRLLGAEPVSSFNQFFIRQSMGQRSGLDYVQSAVTLKQNNYLCPRATSKQQDGPLSVRMSR
jgi:hypothetical protein